MAEAELARFIDRFTMEYVRVYPHPIERVWRAIIEPEEFGAWFIPGRLDPRVGGRYWFGDDGFQGVVEVIEPPRRLRLTDDKAGQVHEYQLAEVPGGTRLRFIHHIPPGHGHVEVSDPPNEADAGTTWDFGGDLPGGPGSPWRPGFVGGFHDMFDRLSDLLDGVPVGSRLAPTAMSRFIDKWASVAPGLNGLTPDKVRERGEIYRSLRSRERYFELIKVYREHIRATCPPG